MRYAAVVVFFFFFSLQSHGQIKIPDAGDSWKSFVDSAISLVKETDSTSYAILFQNCKDVEFALIPYSTTRPPSTIVISVRDMRTQSVNNIACVLVHESYHLYLHKNRPELSPDEEEYLSYVHEYNFICKLRSAEDWLFKNVINMLLYHKSLIKD
jgi:hypothetical protein